MMGFLISLVPKVTAQKTPWKHTLLRTMFTTVFYYYMVALPIMYLSIIIQIIITGITGNQLFLNNYAYETVDTRSKTLTIITMVAYTICNIGDVIQFTSRSVNDPNFNGFTVPQNNLDGSIHVFYHFGNITFFLLLLSKIRRSFQIKRCSMNFLLFLLLLSTIFSALFCFEILYFGGNTSNYEWEDLYLYPTSIALLVCDFTLNFSLLILFIHKIKNKDSIEGLPSILDVAINESDYGDTRRKIWNVMIKHCILFGTSLLANQLWYIMITINLSYRYQLQDRGISFLEEHTIRCIENCVNIFILWLVLRINNDKYVSLCKFCHSCALKCCMGRIRYD